MTYGVGVFVKASTIQVHKTFRFSIQRGGYLYGTRGDDGYESFAKI